MLQIRIFHVNGEDPEINPEAAARLCIWNGVARECDDCCEFRGKCGMSTMTG